MRCFRIVPVLIDSRNVLAAVYGAPTPWAGGDDAPAGSEASAAAAQATAVTTSAATDGGSSGAAHERPQSRPWMEDRHLIFEVRQGEVVALVTDASGQVVRTVPPEELEAMRRERAAHNILLDVRV